MPRVKEDWQLFPPVERFDWLADYIATRHERELAGWRRPSSHSDIMITDIRTVHGTHQSVIEPHEIMFPPPTPTEREADRLYERYCRRQNSLQQRLWNRLRSEVGIVPIRNLPNVLKKESHPTNVHLGMPGSWLLRIYTQVELQKLLTVDSVRTAATELAEVCAQYRDLFTRLDLIERQLVGVAGRDPVWMFAVTWR